MRFRSNNNVVKIIQKLNLERHPEGGYFKQTYSSKDIIPVPKRYDGESRPSSTHIYYLLASDDFSAWHKIKSDEIWHHYSGAPLKLLIIDRDGKLQEVSLGNPLEESDAVPQYCVNHGLWFSAHIDISNSYSLVGCTVSPGFDYRDWRLAKREELILEYPEYSSIIEKYTRSCEKAETKTLTEEKQIAADDSAEIAEPKDTLDNQDEEGSPSSRIRW